MSAERTTIGKRVWPDERGYLPREIDQPARYGRATAERVKNGRAGWWQITAPDGRVGALNPAIHTVTEHDDGTITVTPSIDMSQRPGGGWHGWLQRGVFRDA